MRKPCLLRQQCLQLETNLSQVNNSAEIDCCSKTIALPMIYKLTLGQSPEKNKVINVATNLFWFNPVLNLLFYSMTIEISVSCSISFDKKKKASLN